jgi:nucleoside-diphosphate-sugar epimerase
MKTKILITGGGGFIGTHLAEALANDYRIVLYDTFRRDSLKFCPHLTSNSDIQIARGDVLSRTSLETAMKGVEAVIHLAAIAGVSSYYREPVETLRVNILGTLNVLEAMLASHVTRLVAFSTSEVYGPDADNVSEESVHIIGPVTQKRWVYAVSKLASEHITLRFAEQYGLVCSSVRPFNIYGPRQTGEGAISNFATQLVNRKPLTVYGDGTDVRAWCYISDMVRGVKLILERPASSGHVFNIGNPNEPISTRQLADTMVQLFGSGDIVYAITDHTSIRFRRPNINKASALLGYEPKVTLLEGLTATLKWYQEMLTWKY